MIDQNNGLDVSRETLQRLEQYVELVRKWTPKINLISKASLVDIWTRHIADSLQTVRLATVTNQTHWVDLGSGGGFPGIVAAIAWAETSPEAKFTLIESDQRKCAFLRTAARECTLNVEVKAARIEALEPMKADILSARALASLSDLLQFAERHLDSQGVCLFPKGITWEKELEDAQAEWRFAHEISHSQVESGSVVLKIEGVSRAQ